MVEMRQTGILTWERTAVPLVEVAGGDVSPGSRYDAGDGRTDFRKVMIAPEA